MLKLGLILVGIIAVSQANDAGNPCLVPSAQESCATCIAVHADCAWCVSEIFEEENRLRCDTLMNHRRGKCETKDIQYPNDDLLNVDNRPVQDGARAEDAVQLQPQRVRVKVRPNKPIRVPLVFRQAANYPVDLYYVMDLSNSMEDDKDNLADLGNTISDRMSAITKNFRLGFGSFVDKVVSPYVSTVPEKLESPCNLQGANTEEKCVKPYGFINQMKLDLKTEDFAKSVRAAKVSGNLDAPEGGFDAMMQAIVCEDEIGWRAISRRMMVFSTDAGFHYAGDGKLGGIVTPNDGVCHMKNGEYTHSTKLDYPSVSQIASKIKEKAVSVIFAVTSDQFPIYSKLSQYIESSTTGELANDSSNIVKLIQDNYEKITSKVSLRAINNKKDNISVEFYSRCFGQEEQTTSECGDMKIGESVMFDVEITATSCPADRKDWRKEVVIKAAGYQEKLVLELDLICECECGKPENEMPNSPICSNGNGTYECGKCTCNPKRYGKLCECEADDVNSQESLDKCIAPGSSLVCNGRGKCECGKCQCFTSSVGSTFSGAFCGCDEFSCPRYNGEICGGNERGDCDCGTCKCNDGYEGNACGCEQSHEKCTTDDGQLCGGHGQCVCGQCRCEGKYSGLKCEKCPTCPDKCPDYAPCILCRDDKPSKFSVGECDLKCPLNITEYPEVEESSDVEVCQMKDENKCWIYFSYEYDQRGELVLKRKRDPVCPEAVNVLAIVAGVAGGIVLVGLFLLLLWKLLTWIHDSREYAKFEAERQNAKWDTGENPIYKQATSTFKNPTYGGR